MDDEKKSMAVMNLSAMLDLDDVDKVLHLLENNNWDEAVRSYYNPFIVSSLYLLCSADALRR